MLFKSKELHLLVGAPTLMLATLLVGWYSSQSFSAGRWLGGGSAAGITCGTAAGLIILFEMGLSPKKWLRRIKWLGPARYWMAAHLWLGLVSLPLAIAHSGMTLGGWLPATFMVLFLLTILSGIYGWVVQNVLPRWMLKNLPAETIYGQIDHVSRVTVEDAQQLLVVTCGPPESQEARRFIKEQANGRAEESLPDSKDRKLVIGSTRKQGRTPGGSAEKRRLRTSREDNQQIWAAFVELRPFLEHGGKEVSPVSDSSQAERWFRKLRVLCSDNASELIDMLEEMVSQRRQFDTQKTVHRYLHAWIPLHVALSVAVTVLLAAHVWTALKYW